MRKPDSNDNFEELLHVVAGGRSGDGTENTRVTITYQKLGGKGLTLRWRLGSQHFSAWVDEAQYCNWIEPILPLPRFDKAPPDLLPLLCTWSLAPIEDLLAQAGLEVLHGVGIEPSQCDKGEGWALTFERMGSQKIVLKLIEWPLLWLNDLAEQLTPLSTSNPSIPVPVCLAIGWVRMTLSRLQTLRHGDGLMLDNFSRMEEGEWYLFERQPLARLQFSDDDDICRVEELMDDFDDWLDIEKTGRSEVEEDAVSAVDQIVMTVVAEAGQIELPMTKLAALRPGQILDANVCSHQGIKLKVNGKTIGTGSLLRIGEKLMVRIERLGL